MNSQAGGDQDNKGSEGLLRSPPSWALRGPPGSVSHSQQEEGGESPQLGCWRSWEPARGGGAYVLLMSKVRRGMGPKEERRRDEDERGETPWLQPPRRQSPVANQSTPIPGTHLQPTSSPLPPHPPTALPTQPIACQVMDVEGQKGSSGRGKC